MTRSEYTSRVLAVMRRVTAAEEEAIRAELDAHMEDHIEALLDLGYEPELAEQRTMERMGDPEEVGRALNEQYPLRWLLLKWVAKVICILLVLMLLTQVSWANVWWNLRYRYASNPVTQYKVEAFTFLRDHPVDVRVQIEDVVVRACAAGIMKTADYPYWGMWEDIPDQVHLAAITLCAYSAELDELGIRRRLPNWWMLGYESVSASGCASVWLVPVEPGQENVIITYEKYGQDVCMEIPLDWEGVL